MTRFRLKISRCGGFTLMEALIAMFILAVATVGLCQLLAATSQQTSAAHDRAISEALARQLMEEIASHNLTDSSGAIAFGPAGGTSSRSNYIVVGNYNGYTDTTANLTMLDGTSVSMNLGLVYTRTVTVQYRYSPAGSATTGADAQYALVTVAVSAPLHPTTTLTRMFTRIGSGS